ncbi:SH3 domain-containing protein [Oceanobacillus massiliensis]|uniref:SH3 domain-containing protein n=1 Tax=Oceanobacillus massiliensis TaxID=1465765 RepID=UPI000289DA8D|nr:SH3 domain-containing protein [Oceanobacillus massiliensis]
MSRKKGMLLGVIATAGFILLIIIIMQNGFTSSPTIAQKDSETEAVHNIEETDSLKEKTDETTEDDEKDKPSSKEKLEIDDKENSESTETAKNSAAEEKTEPVTFSTKYVAVSSLNIRKGPGVNHTVIGTVVINEEIEAADQATDGGWVQIKTDTLTGFVNSKYIDDEKIVGQEVIASTQPESNKSNSNAGEKEEENQIKPAKDEKKETEPSPPAGEQNDAQKLKSIGGNNQLILVTANGYSTSSARIQTFERTTEGNWKQLMDVSGFIGKNGFADNKVEGDGKSPVGKFTIGHAFGRAGNPGTKLSYKAITADDVWVDDSNSTHYNSWQSKSATNGQWSSAENMDIPLYTHGFVINYNTARTPGKGSAIFFHIANGHTLGCTGTAKSNVISIIKWLDPAKNPIIIQTPTNGLGNY